ncbi:MAG: aminoglycoside 6-adenylyltransferase [Anaerolineaceae bacterium]|nr:aminoglycoside 6-adenylyltransferase [Anaerolineaceae bacterium]
MRSDQEMYDLILNTARQDDRIRAVILNGSRANPNAQRDRLQDFDIVYIVRELQTFLSKPGWIDRFGERIVMQTPDEMDDPYCEDRQRFAYLMQFCDGNRIDLTLITRRAFDTQPLDSLSVLLLDKDNDLPPFPAPTEANYLPKPPDEREFFNCCNEFWWVCPYVAKGLVRQEIPYARHMHEAVVRPQLFKMLTWYIGFKTDFKVNPGKNGKYFKRYLEAELWEMLKKTYANAEYDASWQALFATCQLFNKIAQDVSTSLGWVYSPDEGIQVQQYLRELNQSQQID